MDYARRSMAPLLFELRLGFVARGADIGKWGLSQYPSEGEILLPPLTAMQMVDSRVEKDIVIVTFRPTVKATMIQTGGDDVKRYQLQEMAVAKAKEEAEQAAAEQAAMEALERHKKENADEAARQWKLTMAETRVKAAQQQAANLKVQLAECRKRELAEKMKRHMSFKHEETYHEEHEKLEEEMRQQLAQLQKMFDDEHKALEAAKAEAEKKRSDASEAAETEACANKQLQWALLNTNARTARARQQEIVAAEREQATHVTMRWARGSRRALGDITRQPTIASMATGVDQAATEEGSTSEGTSLPPQLQVPDDAGGGGGAGGGDRSQSPAARTRRRSRPL